MVCGDVTKINLYDYEGSSLASKSEASSGAGQKFALEN